MRFKCNGCGKTFVYAAKKTMQGLPKEDVATLDALLEAMPDDEELKILGDIFKKFRDQLNFTLRETHVCPYCQSLNFGEVQAASEPKIEGTAMRDWDHTQELLDMGWTVEKRLSSRTGAVMIKYASAEPETIQGYVKNAVEAANGGEDE